MQLNAILYTYRGTAYKSSSSSTSYPRSAEVVTTPVALRRRLELTVESVAIIACSQEKGGEQGFPTDVSSAADVLCLYQRSCRVWD